MLETCSPEPSPTTGLALWVHVYHVRNTGGIDMTDDISVAVLRLLLGF